MEALLISIGLVAAAEIGDKTQLLTLVLAARYRRPWLIVGGIFAATLLNHALAGALGAWLAELIGPDWMRWILGVSFIVMAAWVLIPDRLDESQAGTEGRWGGVFLTTFVLFFLAEIGDKTQIATVALAARFEELTLVVVGTTLGMLLANAPIAWFGEALARRLPMRLVRAVAAALFLALGVAVLAAKPALAQRGVVPGLSTQVVAEGLEHPWALAFLPGGRFLVTERVGRLRVVEADGRLRDPVAGLPAIDVGGQGGLLDLILDRAFEANRQIFFCFTEPGVGGNSTALARARLAPDLSRLESLQVIFSQQPKWSGRHHFGCRIVELPDGTLALTLGERFHRMDDAQRLDNHLGKIVRIAKDGSVPPDNPLVGRAGTRPEILSYGHRNPQGAVLAADGQLWVHEHGPQGGDEINRIIAGRNYGWPVITYGERYGGGPIGEGITARAGMEQPIHHWTPSIAPSGMSFLTSDRYGPAWRGSLFVGTVKFDFLTRVEIQGDRFVREERVAQTPGQWIRDVREGPDGLLYLLNDSRNGRLLRLLPGGPAVR